MTTIKKIRLQGWFGFIFIFVLTSSYAQPRHMQPFHMQPPHKPPPAGNDIYEQMHCQRFAEAQLQRFLNHTEKRVDNLHVILNSKNNSSRLAEAQVSRLQRQAGKLQRAIEFRMAYCIDANQLQQMLSDFHLSFDPLIQSVWAHLQPPMAEPPHQDDIVPMPIDLPPPIPEKPVPEVPVPGESCPAGHDNGGGADPSDDPDGVGDVAQDQIIDLLQGRWEMTGFSDSDNPTEPIPPGKFFSFKGNRIFLGNCSEGEGLPVAVSAQNPQILVVQISPDSSVNWFLMVLTAEKLVFSEGGDVWYLEYRGECQ